MNSPHFKQLILACVLLLAATTAGAQNPTVTLEYKNAPLGVVLESIEKQVGKSFFYEDNLVDLKKGVTISAKTTDLSSILKQLFADTGISFTLSDKHIVLSRSSASSSSGVAAEVANNSTTLSPQQAAGGRQPQAAQAKGTRVSGSVAENDGAPLEFVSVILKGTREFVLSDEKGNYAINADVADGVLIFSLIGYETHEEPIRGRGVVSVTLTPKMNVLADAVVTGYQTISKERSTGSFAKVTSETIGAHRLSDLSTLLEGQVAGYSDGFIRGLSTMNGTRTPLYVIDGFPVENTSIDSYGRVSESLPEINLEDIESITMLKDAAAASIYGARAANGVIVITTKKAKQGRIQVNFSGMLTWKPYSYYTDHLTNSADRIDLERQWAAENPELNNGSVRAQAEAIKRRNNYAFPSQGVNTLLDLYTGAITQAEADAKLAELASRGYAFYDDVATYAKRDVLIQQYNLNVAKATESNNFVASVTYRTNREETAYQKNSMLGVNLANTLQIAKWLRADVGVFFSHKDNTTPTYNFSSSFYSGFNPSPYDRLVDANGNNVTMPSQVIKTVRDNIANYGLYNVDVTPLNELNRRLTQSNAFSNRSFGKLEVKPFKWLSYNAMFQYEYGVNRINRQEEFDSYATRTTVNKFANLANGKVVYNLPAGDIHYAQNHFSNAYNFRQQLNLNNSFGNGHELTAILGSETQNTRLEYRDETLYGYDSEMLSYQYINQPLLTGGFTGLMNSWASLSNTQIAMRSELINRFVSLYANAAYSYRQRYALTGSIRWDRSNLWGTNSKYQNKPLWSVGASWNVTNEDFFKVGWVNMLKLRASYGIGGNIAKDASPYLTASYSTSALVGGLYGSVSSPPNPNLRWEKTISTNIGFDFSILKNRLSGTFDVYNKNSKDLLANQMGVPTEGFGFYTLKFNNGAMRNRGFELTLQGDILQGSDFRWNSIFLIGYNKSKVTRIFVKAPIYYLQLDYPQSYPVEGNAFTGIYGYKWAGLDASGEPQIYDENGTVTKTNYQSLDAIHYLGTTMPVYSGSFTNTLTYKNIDFSVMLLYAGGHKVRDINIPAINMGGSPVVLTTSSDIRNRWRQAGDELLTNVPAVRFSGMPGYNTGRESIYRGSDILVYNASHMRINNILLAYRLPQAWCQKANLSAVRVQFNIENLAFVAFDSKAKYSLGGYVKPTYTIGLFVNY